MAEKALQDGQCDMIMLGRPLLADPEWCNKAFEGRVEDICPASAVRKAVSTSLWKAAIQCAVNARTGFEDSIPEQASPALRKKKIGVVGGSPAGVIFCSGKSRGRAHSGTDRKDRPYYGRIVSGSVPAVSLTSKTIWNG